jgi:hypothetical protein
MEKKEEDNDDDDDDDGGGGGSACVCTRVLNYVMVPQLTVRAVNHKSSCVP